MPLNRTLIWTDSCLNAKRDTSYGHKFSTRSFAASLVEIEHIVIYLLNGMKQNYRTQENT